MKTRLLSLILTVCMLIALCPTAVSAEDNTTPVSRLLIHSSVRCRDNVVLTLTGDNLVGKYFSINTSGAFVFELIESAPQTITLRRMENETIVTEEYRYASDKSGTSASVVVTPSVPEGFTLGYSVNGDTMTITIGEVLTDIIGFDPTGKTASGKGWSWSDDGKTLTIDSAYVLNESEPIHCEKLILNGIVRYALMPDLKELEGRHNNFEGGTAINVSMNRANGMKYITITSDKPFTLSDDGVEFRSDEDNKLNIATSKTELTIVSGLNGNHQEAYGVTIDGNKLKLSQTLNSLDDLSTDDSWLNDNTIRTAAHLESLSYQVNHGNSFNGETITLGNDIDLSEIEFTPIGTGYNKTFKGTFDGNDHTITLGKLKGVTDTDSIFGLFGTLDTGAVVKNLTVDGEISFETRASGDVFLGGIAGEMNKGATLFNCVSDAKLNARANFSKTLYIGGLVGWLGGEIVNSAFTGSFGSVSGTGICSASIASFVETKGNYSDPVVRNCFSTPPYPPFTTSVGLPKICENVFYPDSAFNYNSNVIIRIPEEQIKAASGTTNDSWYGGKALIDLLNDYIDQSAIADAKKWYSGKGGIPSTTLKPSISLINENQSKITLTEGYTDNTLI